MKKALFWIGIIIITSLTLLLSYDYKNNQSPKTYYRVYLNDEILGIIDSSKKLDKFINKESDYIKNKYGVEYVYAPEGLYVEPISSYDSKIDSVEEIFNLINDKAVLRIDGYQISVKSDDEQIIIYVTEQEVFRNAVLELIKTFVGANQYQSYIDNTQLEIINTGSIIENVYVENNITVKKTKIPINEHIYQDVQELSRFLLFGKNYTAKKYKVKLGDTISKVSYENEISTEEFLLSNPQFTDKNNLLHVGEEVNIIVTDPQLKVISETYEVVDMDNAYIIEERYDETKYIGDDQVIQEGENGLLRVTQNVQRTNGSITFIDPIDKVELKPVINKIIIKGKKEKPHVGDLNNWAWPTSPGYTITDDFEWRTNPITGKREHHSGIDISGLGYGAPIYAANNGVVTDKRVTKDYGLNIIINHNNGYYTLYAHMSRFADNIEEGTIVMRGQLIGYIGSTGYATGPHLHFELWKDCRFCRINPLNPYR